MTSQFFHWEELAKQIKSPLLMQHPLSRYNTWRIGGCGEAVLIPTSIADIETTLRFIAADFPMTWLGLGSNVLIPDQGLPGLVIITQGSVLDHIKLEGDVVYAQAGVPCGQLARFVARHEKVGLEFLAGIPGTLGGALAMNAGCYGSEIWDQVSHVETIDIYGVRHLRQKNAYTIGYRTVTYPTQEFFLGAYFSLIEGSKAQALLKIKQLLEKRNLAQPTNFPNCGSVFKNPPGHFAAALIQACNLKGQRIGGAQISNKHANFIVNIDQASAADILALVTLAKTSVQEKFGIRLQQEFKILREEEC